MTGATHAGLGQDRKETRRRRGGRGRRGHEESSLDTAHRKPASPKLADLIMPALQAKALAQSQDLDAQMSTQEAKASPARSTGAADSPTQGTKPGNDLAEDPRRYDWNHPPTEQRAETHVHGYFATKQLWCRHFHAYFRASSP